MSGSGTTAAAAPSQLGASVVPLLALATFINYVDRGNLATAAPLLKGELHLSSTQVGLLFSAFFWAYVPALILAAWLAERINPYRVLALGVLLWSSATALMGLAGGFASLLALRLLLGLGEGAAFPCSSQLIAKHVPNEQRGSANGLISVGLALGPAFGTFIGALLMAKFGWRPVFLVFGLASAVWLIPWWGATRRAFELKPVVQAEKPPSFFEILSRRDALGACLGHFCNLFTFYFVILWMPSYLVQARGLSVSAMGVIGGLIYLAYAASSYLSGIASDYLMRQGASATLVRKGAMGVSSVIVFASMLAAAFGDASTSIAALFCAGIAFGMATPTIFAIAQTLAGPIAAGKWVGVQNSVANTAGIVAPMLTGFVIDQSGGQFGPAFLIAAIVQAVGFFGWTAIIGHVAPVSWRRPANAQI